jgi:hypothetical protein
MAEKGRTRRLHRGLADDFSVLLFIVPDDFLQQLPDAHEQAEDGSVFKGEPFGFRSRFLIRVMQS